MHETESLFNKVYVIESLGPTDLHGGRHLVEEIEPTIDRLGLGLCYWDAPNAAAFRSAMGQIAAQCQRPVPRIYPLLHVDAHGAENGTGLLLRSGETVSWSEFGTLCRAINIASANHLIVTSGLCYGMRAITEVDIKQPAPFLALVAAEDALPAKDADSISMFYNEILRSGDLEAAHARLSALFQVFHAERLLIRAYARYIHTACSGRGRKERIESLLSRTQQAPHLARVPLRRRRLFLKAAVKPSEDSYTRFKERFLLSTAPGNEDRFRSTLADVQRLADALAGRPQ